MVEPAGPGPHNGPGRSSFLSGFRGTPSAAGAAAADTVNATPCAENVGANVARQQEDGESAAAHRRGVEAQALGWATIWTFNW